MNTLTSPVHRTGFFAALLCAALLLAGCVENPALSESRNLMVQGMLDQSVARLAQGMRDDPSNKELRAQYFRQRDLVTAQLVAQAQGEMNTGELDAAEVTLGRVQKMDPNSPRLRNGQAEIAVRRRMNTLLREADALQAKGDAAGAERTLRSVLSQFPKHPQAAQRLLVLGRGRVGRLLPDAYRAVRALTSVTVWHREAELDLATVRACASGPVYNDDFFNDFESVPMTDDQAAGAVEVPASTVAP